jgi:hypothetical protein
MPKWNVAVCFSLDGDSDAAVTNRIGNPTRSLGHLPVAGRLKHAGTALWEGRGVDPVGLVDAIKASLDEIIKGQINGGKNGKQICLDHMWIYVSKSEEED